MSSQLPKDRLLAIIDVQNEIAASALDPEAVMTLVVRRAQNLTGAAGAVIERASGDELVYQVGSGAGEAFAGIRVQAADSLSGLCLRQAETLYCADAETDERVDPETTRRVGIRSMLCAPLVTEGQALGVLRVFSDRVDAFGHEDEATLSLLARPAAAHMSNVKSFRRAREESRHDILTGLPNRRAFEERLGSEVARIRRHGGELSMAVLDLDGFKVINDSLGHAVGDEVLRAVATHLAQVRGEDAAFRLEGDEFAIIYAEADAEGATIAVRRLEAAVLADHGCGGIGVSWGVAALHGGDPAALVADAYAELYRVKRMRNNL